MSKFKKITVSNLKAISKLTADFNGCTAIITGGNNKGKSSFLRSLADRLRGDKTDIILKHNEQEGFYELELTTGEKFVWTFEKKREKLTFVTERDIKTSVTKEISNHYFPPIFDVDAFLNAAPKKQKEDLQKITGIDFFEFDKKYAEAYDERTYRNKQLATEKAKAEFIDKDLPDEEADYMELEKELAGVDAYNEKITYVSRGVQEKAKQMMDYENEIIELERKIDELKEKRGALSIQISNGKTWLDDPKNQPKENVEELAAKIKAIKEQNEKIRLNKKAKEQDAIINKAIALAAEADKKVKALEQEKMDVIKNASLPDGFGFTDEGLTYNGYPFNKQQLSSSGIYIAALKLASLGLGEVKTLHFDASFLDKNSLAEIEKWANESGLQLLIERPDFDGGEIEYQIVNTIFLATHDNELQTTLIQPA